jgi:hypothetical protein
MLRTLANKSTVAIMTLKFKERPVPKFGVKLRNHTIYCVKQFTAH